MSKTQNKTEAVNARGAGRPSKPDKERRSARLEIRLTQAEYALIRRFARPETMSDWLRGLASRSIRAQVAPSDG